ncbi:MAG: PLDc N-terminal domain-containing protein [Jatrophihabitans sp.]|uniref:PLDc N-terminal domain-containing protein n=1 Tax=Jatrophihabitans sp. TaxID=1932789 RepID=UPI003F7D3FA8
MILFDGGLAVLALGVWLFCIIDVITTPEGECRNLPKLVWLILVILLVDLGSLAWLIAGRNWNGRGASAQRFARGGGAVSARHDRPGRTVPSNPDDDEEFLALLRTRAEEQRRRAREAQRPTEGDTPPAD